MILLAIDTAANLCAACVHDGQRELGRSVRDIGKGHAEQLMDVIAEALEAGGMDYSGLDAIAVSVGPGSFTGIRVGVATARGLALALQIPAIGVTTLEALASEARANGANGTIMSAIDAGRDGLYVAVYDASGTAINPPAILDMAAARAMVSTVATICGSAAERIAGEPALGRKVAQPKGATADIAAYALLAIRQGISGKRPSPLYLRAPDAKPQAHSILSRSGG